MWSLDIHKTKWYICRDNLKFLIFESKWVFTEEQLNQNFIWALPSLSVSFISFWLIILGCSFSVLGTRVSLLPECRESVANIGPCSWSKHSFKLTSSYMDHQRFDLHFLIFVNICNLYDSNVLYSYLNWFFHILPTGK